MATRRSPWTTVYTRLTAMDSELMPQPLADLVTQTNSSATAGASGSFIDEFNPRGLQRRHDFRQTFDYSPNDTIARFHPLDCRKRDPGGLGQRLLFHPGKSPCRSHLCRGQQIRPPSKRLSG